ncbi:MAG: MBOAT family protein [Lachnospiraceae bacterium]|nr:MBOAT family protein [Lachnospiraceae bacterium]
MQFTSYEFLIFFPVVVLMYYVIPKRLRQLWLLAASYYFYMGWNAQYALLILVSTLTTYLCAVFMGGVDNGHKKRKRRRILVAGLAVNLAILVFFKYFYFVHGAIGTALAVFGVKIAVPEFDILLPVGISFYTFQALGYVIDVYRGTVKPEKNVIRYALFVSFFPQLVAGPIERSGHLLGQLEKISHEKLWDFDKVTRGLLMMLWGFFMKMVIADRAAVLVNQVYDQYYMYSGMALLLASVLFAVEIYCDFAGYSVIAIGAAKILGIELMVNFEAPFFSTSVSALWRRWHISLSTWFRDYLYIPLGGNRCSRPRKYFNSMVTFATSGLWHGASWNYVVWGVIQGMYIIIGDITRPFRTKLNGFFGVRVKSFGCQFIQGVCTFLLFVLSLVFFRADTVGDGVYYIQRMFLQFDVWTLFDESIYHLGLDRKEMGVLWIGILILLIVDAYYVRKKALFDSLVKEQCLAVQYVIVAALLVLVIVFGVYGDGYDAAQFIYFQF